MANRGWLAVPGVDDRVVRERKQDAADGIQQDAKIATREIDSADRSGKQRVTDKQGPLGLRVAADGKTDATRAMTGRVVHPRAVVSKPPRAAPIVVKVNGRLPICLNAQHLPLLFNRVVEKQICLV